MCTMINKLSIVLVLRLHALEAGLQKLSELWLGLTTAPANRRRLSSQAKIIQCSNLLHTYVRDVPAGNGGEMIRAVLASMISPATNIALYVRFDR